MNTRRAHAVPARPRAPAHARLAAAGTLAAALAAGAARAEAAPVLEPRLLDAVHAEVLAAARAERERVGAAASAEIVVTLGRLDPRLRLAPCGHVEHRLAGAPWGPTRVALRCAEGPSRWQVHLPVTVQVRAPGWVATADLPAGTVLGGPHLQPGVVDLAAGATPLDGDPGLGRTLARAVRAGEPLRAPDLRPRRWFDAGDPVRLDAVGPGYRISGRGQALAPGVEGKRVRVRTDGGRVVTGLPVGAGRVEVTL